MKNRLWCMCFVFVAAHVCGASVVPVSAATVSRSLTAEGGERRAEAAVGTVTGSVLDASGRPLSGAIVSLLREGATQAVRQTRSLADGSFAVRAVPGRYVLQAVADGFNSVSFPAVNVAAADELVYRFNLQRVGEGRTTAEQRRDRDDPKWRLRAASSRRSIFQADEDSDPNSVVASVEEEVAGRADDDEDGAQILATGSAPMEEQANRDLQGIVESYYAASDGGLNTAHYGLNFALRQSVNDRFNFIVSGQFGSPGAPQRLELQTLTRLGGANSRHALRTSVGGARLFAPATLPLSPIAYSDLARDEDLGQLNLRAVDEWIVREGVVVVLGLDYARFIGAGDARTISPRFGVRYDLNARTRLSVALAPGGDETTQQQVAEFEDGNVHFQNQSATHAVARRGGRPLLERSRRLEFGVERILDLRSRIEATAFFDTTNDRGVGLLSFPANAFRGDSEAEFATVANQTGAARGVRVVYVRRMNKNVRVSAGYSFGRGQELSPDAPSSLANSTPSTVAPDDIFRNGYFQTAAAQVDAKLADGTEVQAVFRFSPRATVFAIDPFAGRLAVFDPSLSILLTQELPTFGLPVRVKAIIDARNLLDGGTIADDVDAPLVMVAGNGRSVRGGISVRF